MNLWFTLKGEVESLEFVSKDWSGIGEFAISACIYLKFVVWWIKGCTYA